MRRYDDIINIDFKLNHPRMPLKQRAASFAPFAALLGYSESLKEESREVDKYIYLDNDKKIEISNNINKLVKNISKVKIKYFIEDKIKYGVNYKEIVGIYKKIKLDTNELIINNKKIIINNIIDLEIVN